jgi:hypothetical protein
VVASIYNFASYTSLPSGNYFGLGVDQGSPDYYRCTVVVPKACVATSIVFSIRESSGAGPYKATLNVNGVDSSLTVTITDGTVAPYANAATGSVTLNEFDLICISTDWRGAALNRGACATVTIA